MPAMFKKLSSSLWLGRARWRKLLRCGEILPQPIPSNPLTKRCLGGNLVSLGRSQKAAPCSIQAAEERELKLLKRIRREVRPSMDRGGSRGAAHNRGSRGLVTVLSSAQAFSVSSGARR